MEILLILVLLMEYLIIYFHIKTKILNIFHTYYLFLLFAYICIEISRIGIRKNGKFPMMLYVMLCITIAVQHRDIVHYHSNEDSGN